jgi:hypothetical protein
MTTPAWAWGSHLPLLESLIQVVHPELILELGMGRHSTPLFARERQASLLFVENDKKWLVDTISSVDFGNNCTFSLHQLPPEIKIATKPVEISPAAKDDAVSFYRRLAERLQGRKEFPKMMFADQFTCCRTFSINELHPHFSIVAYHDCEPAGIRWYNYRFRKTLLDGFDHCVLKTPDAWTGCFIRKDMNIIEAVREAIREPIQRFASSHGLNKDRFVFDSTVMANGE